MTNEELIAKIKVEIERQIKLHDSLASNAESEMIANLEIGAAQALEDILPFLNTLESEKPICSFDELDHEADDWIDVLRADSGTNDDWNIGDIYRTAQHFAKWGAEWQKEQSLMESHKAWMDHKSSMIKQIEKAEWRGYDKGLADGIVLGKEQMLKEAVEIEVWNYSSCKDLRALPLWGIDKFNNLEDGDKVRVIIVKED